jgi:hypothetical protein
MPFSVGLLFPWTDGFAMPQRRGSSSTCALLPRANGHSSKHLSAMPRHMHHLWIDGKPERAFEFDVIRYWPKNKEAANVFSQCGAEVPWCDYNL